MNAFEKYHWFGDAYGTDQRFKISLEMGIQIYIVICYIDHTSISESVKHFGDAIHFSYQSRPVCV